MVAWAPIIAAGASIYSALKKNKKPKKRSTMDKRQQALWADYDKGLRGEGPLADLYNFDVGKAQQNFQQNVARPAYENYQENVIPEITGAFRGRGLGNSTYAGQALERGGRMVQQDLNAKMNDYMYNQEQAIQNRKANGINNFLNTQTFAYEKPRQNWFDSALEAGASKFGGAFGDYAFNSVKNYMGG